MDTKLREKMDQKINEIFDNPEEIIEITRSLTSLAKERSSFSYGLVIGRLYNSFYYQSRRILQRNPTKDEFSEFLDMLKQHETEFSAKLKLDE